jgi:nucleoid-associated protein YgaU
VSLLKTALNMPSGGLVKAVIRERDGSGKVSCAFNPTEYEISKSAEWKQETTLAAAKAPSAQFMGTKARELSMTLLFDAWGSGKSIAADIDKLLGWMNPTSASLRREDPMPPALTFTWGRNQFFAAYLKSAGASYKLFDTDGTPLRATVKVTLVELPTASRRQNPTSGSTPGRRTALVTSDASLASIAQAEYGRASLWRGLAAANGISDPFRVPAGTSLLVPSRADVEALS